MRRRLTSTAGAGSVTTVLAIVLWLAVQAGTTGGEAPFPVSDWAGPSYGTDPHHAQDPASQLSDEVSGDAVRDRFPLQPVVYESDTDPREPRTQPPPAATPTPTPEPTVSPTPEPTDAPTPSPTPTPTPPRRYQMDVQMFAGRTTARPGDHIRYTIRVQNTGTETLRNVKSETHIPQGTVRAECSGSGSFTVCTAAPDGEDPGEHQDTWIGVLGAGETFTFTFDVIVKPSTQKGFKIKTHAHAYAPDTGRETTRTVTVTVV